MTDLIAEMGAAQAAYPGGVFAWYMTGVVALLIGQTLYDLIALTIRTAKSRKNAEEVSDVQFPTTR